MVDALRAYDSVFKDRGGPEGSGVGGDTVVARAVTVKLGGSLFREGSVAAEEKAVGTGSALDESRPGERDRRRPWCRLARSYSQDIQSEASVTTKDVLRSGPPGPAVVVRRLGGGL